MHGGLDAVVHLDVELGEGVVLVGAGLPDVPEGGGVDDVADDEPLDGLVLGDGLACGYTAHTLDVSAALLVTSVGAALYGHFLGNREAEGVSLWIRGNEEGREAGLNRSVDK